MNADELLASLKKKADEVSAAAGSFVHKAASGVVSKQAAAINEFTRWAPTFERAGFSLLGLDVEVGLPPKMIARFGYERRIPDAEKEKILREVKEERGLNKLMGALFKAVELQEGVQLERLNLSHIAVHIGAIPRVSVCYRRR